MSTTEMTPAPVPSETHTESASTRLRRRKSARARWAETTIDARQKNLANATSASNQATETAHCLLALATVAVERAGGRIVWQVPENS